MDAMPPGDLDSAGGSRYHGVDQAVTYDVCVRCCQPSAGVLTQELMGSAPAGAFVVGSTPDDLGAMPMNAPSWTLVHWLCNICESSWYSYIVYAQAYDCRIDDPLYSPRALAQRSRANSTQYSAPSTPHCGSAYGGGNATAPVEQTCSDLPPSEPNLVLGSTTISFLNSQSLVPSAAFRIDDDNTQYASTEQDFIHSGKDNDRHSTWSPLRLPPGPPHGESRARANSDARHKRGPHFDPQGYRRTRDRGACEMHKRNKKACRHPENEGY